MSTLSITADLTAADSALRAEGAAAAYVLSPDVLFIAADDGTARLLDLGGEFFSVSEVGAIMLDVTLKRGTEAAVREVARQFAADPSQVRGDLVALLADFEKKRLIRKVNAATPARPRRARHVVAWLLALPLPIILASPVSLKLKAFVLLMLARMSCALGGWTATIRAWTPRKRPSTADVARDSMANEIDRAVRAAASAHVFQVACKERALSCWALASTLR